MSDEAKKIPKSKTTVTVRLTDGDTFEGHFFVSDDQRLTDLLNGPTQYLPFEALNGTFHVINKSMIVRVIARDAASAEQGGVFNAERPRW